MLVVVVVLPHGRFLICGLLALTLTLQWPGRQAFTHFILSVQFTAKWLATLILTFLCFYFILKATVLSKQFLLTGVFYLTLLFVTQMRTETSHSGSFSMYAVIELSLLVSILSWTTDVLVTRPVFYYRSMSHDV